MKKIISLLLAVMLVLGLAACAPASNNPSGNSSAPSLNQEEATGQVDVNAAKYGGVLDVAWVGEGANSYAPTASGNATYAWSTSVFEGVLSRDSEGNLHPGVCDFTVSEDQLTLTLTPRAGVKFHNGKEVTIDDIWASICGNKDSKMEDYVRLLVADGYPEMNYETNTMTLVFTSYDASTLFYLSQNATYLPVLPKEVWEKYGDLRTNAEIDATATDTFDPWADLYNWDIDAMVGTGPYKIDKDHWEEGYRVALVKNPDYVQKDATLTAMAGARYGFFDQINVWYNSEANAVAMGLMDGTYDIASVGVSFDEQLMASGMQRIADPSKKIVYMAFNTKSHTMQDENLRKAIAAAIDYETLMAINYGQGCYTLETSPMAEGAYFTTKFSDVDYAGAANMELAQQYLAKSAYAGETIKFLHSDGQADLAAYIKSVIESLGLTYEADARNANDWKSAYANTTDNDFDMIVAASAQSELLPSNLVTNLRVRYWQNDIEYAEDAFARIGALPYGSADSLALWDEMSDKWVADAHIVPLGCNVASWYATPDLNVHFPGAFVAFYNCYWENPADHTN